MKKQLIGTLAALLLGAMLPGVSNAAAPNWSTAGSGNWTDTARWSTSLKPVAADTVTFNAAGQNGAETIYLNGNQAATSLTFANTGITTLLGGTASTSANNTLTIGNGGIILNSGAGAVVIGDPVASPTAKVDLTLSGAISNNSTNTLTINNAVTWSIAGSPTVNAVGGTGNVIFNGAVTSTISGGPTYLFNAPLTSFNGGFGMTTGTSARTNTFGGAGNVSITGLSNGNGTATGNIFNWSNSGTLTLNGTSVSGAVNLNAGTTLLTGDHTSNASQPLTTFTVGSGATPVTSVTSPVGVNTGNAILKIVGNRSLGAAGAGNTTLVIKGGNTGGTPIGQGTLSLVDSTINTLTINNATASSTLLTLAGGAGLSSILNMEIGNNTADQIVLANTGKISIGAGGVALNIAGIGGFTGGNATQNLNLISAPGGGLTAGGTQFTLATTTGNFGGYTTAVLTNTTTTALVLTLGGYTAAPTTAYWKGGVDGNWNGFTGGNSNISNWTDSAGTTNTFQKPGATTDVVFNAADAGNTTTTLGQDFSIKSLTFNSTASISGNTLTVNNTTTGITANTGATGTINSILGGSTGVTKNGVGTVILGGSNTFTGGLAINDGVVQVANAGALNSTTPQAVAFGNTASTNPKLQLNGISLTIGALSATATNNSPIIENANVAAATLTVSQATNSTYAGVIQNGTGGGALGLIKSGGGTLALGGANSYTGTTAVNAGTLLVNGNSTAANGLVSVAATLGGNGTVGGATTITNGGRITGADIGTTGTLAISSSLSINSGGIGYFDIINGGAYDSIAIGGGLTLTNGAYIKVSGGLTTAATYNLFTYTGADPSLSGINFLSLTDNVLGSNYGFTSSNGSVVLTITSASKAIPSINIALSTTSRLMQSTAIGVNGTVGNSGPVSLNGALSDGGGNLAVSSFSPSGDFTVSANGTQAYTGSSNSGATLGNRTLGVTVSDPAADPTSVTASTTVSVLQDRVVSASTVAGFGSVHQNATVNGTTSLTSAGADDSNTRVTVANAGADANGISVTGGTDPTFNGSTSDTRTVSGNISALGVVSGNITLTTTGEAGISGTQNPVNVSVLYSASVYSGKAAWTSGASGSWVTGSNWADTLGGGVAGSPGVDGALSIGDTATFGNVAGSPASLTVSLNGTSPTLAGITFNSSATAYTIAAGSGGSITLQGAATPVDVSTSFSPTISAALAGSGLNKTGTGTLILSGASSYTGATEISNGAIQITGGNDRLPTTTALTLGNGTASGKLILGDATTARNQTLAGLTTTGTGTANSVVGAAAANSVLTVNLTSNSTYAGTLGGPGANENNLTLAKSGAGTLILTGTNTYIGGTTLTAGSLNLGSANAIGTTGTVTFSGGALQFSAANTTDYSNRFATTGNSAYNIDTNGHTVTFANALAASGTSGLTKSGAGGLILSAAPTYTGTTTINNGYLQIGNASNLSSGALVFNGGTYGSYAVLQTQGTITRTLAAAGNIYWSTSGGFAAKGGALTLNFSGGAAQNWGTGGFMGTGLTPMVFGSSTSDNLVTLQNSFDFGIGSTNTLSAGFNRTISVDGAAATLAGGTGNYGVTGNAALISGTIMANAAIVGNSTATNGGDLGNNGFVKTGSGTLILSGNNTYSGTTTVSGGTLIAGNNALLGTGVAGAFGDGHQVIQSNLAVPITTNGTQAIALGNGNINGSDGTTATNASPTVLIGGAYTVGLPISISTTITTNGTYGIGGSTDNTATFSGLITAGQNFSITQVATTGSNALDITGGITGGASAATKTANFNNAGAVNVSTTAISDGAGGGKMAVTQSGAGTTTFSAANTYTGATTVSAGTLLVSGSGTVNTTSGISITGGIFDYQNNTAALTRNVTVTGGTFKNNSTQNYTGALTFTSGTVGGTNLSGVALTIGANQAISPGNSPGKITTGAETWTGGGTYVWEINNATGIQETNWDFISGGALDINGLSSSSKFNINLIGLAGNVSGAVLNWDGSSAGQWKIATFSSIAGTFAANLFYVDTTGFINNNAAPGTFGVSNVNNDLFLTYAVPEPSTWALLAFSLTTVMVLRRRRN